MRRTGRSSTTSQTSGLRPPPTPPRGSFRTSSRSSPGCGRRGTSSAAASPGSWSGKPTGWPRCAPGRCWRPPTSWSAPGTTTSNGSRAAPTRPINTAVVRAADQLVHLKAQVRALSPQKTLDRGYAVVQLSDDGEPVPGTRRDVVRHPGAGAGRHPADGPRGRRPVHRAVHRRPGARRQTDRPEPRPNHPPRTSHRRTVPGEAKEQGAPHGSRNEAEHRHRRTELRGRPRTAGRHRRQAGGRRRQPGGIPGAVGARRGAGQAL